MEKLLKLSSADHPLFVGLFAGHAALILPAETSEASDRVPAAHGEAAEAVIS
jgi:hypothetical protein